MKIFFFILCNIIIIIIDKYKGNANDDNGAGIGGLDLPTTLDTNTSSASINCVGTAEDSGVRTRNNARKREKNGDDDEERSKKKKKNHENSNEKKESVKEKNERLKREAAKLYPIGTQLSRYFKDEDDWFDGYIDRIDIIQGEVNWHVSFNDGDKCHVELLEMEDKKLIYFL
jgi:hypothetical protein